MYFLADAGIFALIVAALVGLSWWSAHPKRTGLENTVINSSAFLGGLALAIWLLGSNGLLRATPWLLPAGMLVILVLTRRQGWQNFKAHAAAARQTWHGLGRLEKLLTFYLLVVFALTFVLALAPPTSNDYDSLVYHLAAPQQYMQAGFIGELPYDHHSYFPFTMEMLFMLGLWLKGPVLAKLFHWLMLPLACLALVAIGKRHLTARAGLLAAVLLATLPVVQSEASTAYIDIALATFSLLAFLCFANWLAGRDRWWLAWCGVFCGFCLGTKFLGVLTFGWLGLWALGSMARRRDWDVPALAACGGWALLLGGGWYLRNWMWTGNPVYPFAYEIFGGRGWSAEMAKEYTKSQAIYGFGHSFSDWLWLPWRVAMAPLNTVLLTLKGPALLPRPYFPFLESPLNNGLEGMFEVKGHVLQSFVGPALLAFSLPLLAIRRKPAVVGFILWSFLFFWVFWAATSQQIRYLIPAFAILCLAGGWGAEQFLRRSAALKWSVLLMLAGWMAFAPAYTAYSARRNWATIAGQMPVEEFLARNVSGYGAMTWASTQTPPNARFAVYGEPRCFYLKRDYFLADDPHNNLIDYGKLQDAAGLVKELQRLGATHVLVNEAPGGNGGVFGPPPQFAQAVGAGEIRPIFEERGYRVFEIVKAPGSER